MKVFKILIILVFSYNFVCSQSQVKSEPDVAVVTSGILIYCGNTVPNNGYYVIQRKLKSENRYEEIAKTSAPKSKQQLIQRGVEANKHFQHLKPLQEQDYNRIYEYLQSNTKDSTLYRIENLPMTLIAAGTGFLDLAVEKGKTYHYKISYYENDRQLSEISIKPITNTLKTNLPIPKAYSAETLNNEVHITWLINEIKEMVFFNVYRSYFGTDDFKKISVEHRYSSSNKKIHAIAIDTTTEKSSFYKYYIKPVDLRGNEGKRSEIISAGKLKTETLIPITNFKAEELKNHAVKLSWKLDKQMINNNIQVWRSPNYDTDFVQITNLPPNTESFVDKIPEASENYYYYLVVDGSGGQKFTSATIAAMVKTNSTPLPAVFNISAIATNKGSEISWEYDEPFTNGFYVYRSDVKTSSFYQVSNLIKTDKTYRYSYIDTTVISSYIKGYQYFVRPENDGYLLGKASDTVTILSGKKQLPPSPLKVTATLRDSNVEVVWKDMRIASNSILGYKVYRSKNNQPFKFIQNDTLKASKNYYHDKDITTGQTYTYRITTIDISGQESAFSITTQLSISANNKIAAPPDKPVVFKNSEGIHISWGRIASNLVKEVKVYRGKLNSKHKLIHTSSTQKEHFFDKKLSKGNIYYYQISLVNTSGIETEKSERAFVNF